MQSSNHVVLSASELKTKWDQFSKIFQQRMEPSTNISAYSLISSLNIREEKVKRILDLGKVSVFIVCQ